MQYHSHSNTNHLRRLGNKRVPSFLHPSSGDVLPYTIHARTCPRRREPNRTALPQGAPGLFVCTHFSPRVCTIIDNMTSPSHARGGGGGGGGGEDDDAWLSFRGREDTGPLPPLLCFSARAMSECCTQDAGPRRCRPQPASERQNNVNSRSE